MSRIDTDTYPITIPGEQQPMSSCDHIAANAAAAPEVIQERLVAFHAYAQQFGWTPVVPPIQSATTLHGTQRRRYERTCRNSTSDREEATMERLDCWPTTMAIGSYTWQPRRRRLTELFRQPCHTITEVAQIFANPRLHAVLKLSYELITPKNVKELKRLHGTSLPVPYPESFYKNIIQQKDLGLSKLAYWRNNLVGAICTSRSEQGCRADGAEAATAELCILTLAVYAPYRGKGIGSRLLQTVLDACPEKGISTVTLQVHVANEDAVRFYTDRFGFVTEALLHNYYRRLVPPHCLKLRKELPLVDETRLDQGVQ